MKVIEPEESQAAPTEEPGPRPRINLRGVMRSISLLEPPSELESTSGAEDPPEVRLGLGKEPQLRQGGGQKEEGADGRRMEKDQDWGHLSTETTPWAAPFGPLRAAEEPWGGQASTALRRAGEPSWAGACVMGWGLRVGSVLGRSWAEGCRQPST